MDQDQINGEYQDERDALLASLEPTPPFDPEAFAPEGDEPDVDEQPQDEQQEEDPREEVKRLKEQLAQRDSETAAERQRREALEQREAEQNRVREEEFARQWQAEFQQALEHAQTLPHREAINFMAQFTQHREQRLYQAGLQYYNELQGERLTKQAQKIAADNGLPDDEVSTLVRAAQNAGNNPAAMHEEAKRLKAREDRLSQKVRATEEELKRLKAESTRQKFANSPARRTGSGNRTASKTYKPGSREQLADLLGMTG